MTGGSAEDLNFFQGSNVAMGGLVRMGMAHDILNPGMSLFRGMCPWLHGLRKKTGTVIHCRVATISF